MPLLVCPNDNSAMQTVNRSGVEFDFCPNLPRHLAGSRRAGEDHGRRAGRGLV
jgi:Zn-finger nucleic acid-binding protein